MIKWSDKLYMDAKIQKNPEKWKRRIEAGKLSASLFCIALASNPENLFDIMNCNELWFRYYRQKDICIVALAADKGSAEELLQTIVRDIYKETGKFKVREYFGCNSSARKCIKSTFANGAV